MSAPTPFDTFAAGAFYGLLRADPTGMALRDVEEDDVRLAMREWLEERAAEAAS